MTSVKAQAKAKKEADELLAHRQWAATMIGAADEFWNALDELEFSIRSFVGAGGDARLMWRAIAQRFSTIGPSCNAIIAASTGEPMA